MSEIATIVASYLQPDGPGLALAVIQDGNVIHRQGYGLANLEWQLPVATNTVFQLASVTKPFTALAIMILQEQGKLDSNDPLTKHYRKMPLRGNDVRLHHLLSHTSGIADIDDVENWFPDQAWDDKAPDELIKAVRGLPYHFPTGSEFRYSNVAYNILGLVIEQVAGMPYEALIRSQIFEPLGMHDSHYMHNHTIIPNRAAGYALANDGVNYRHPPRFSMEQPFAAGGLGSSLDDLILFDQALREAKLINTDTLAQMQTPFALTDGFHAPCGYGWFLGEYCGHKVASHGGGIEGFSTYFAQFLDEPLTIICLANREHFPVNALVADVASYLLGVDQTRYQQNLLGDEERLRVIGNYQLMGFGVPIDIWADDAGLYVNMPEGTMPLHTTDPYHYWYLEDGKEQEIRFADVPNAVGQFTHGTLHHYFSATPLRRIASE